MSLVSNFVAVIMSTATAFTGTFSEVEMTAPPEESQTVVRSNVDVASSIASSSSMTSGIVVVDRATGNTMVTNGSDSHREFELQTLGRLPILLYAVRTDSEVAKGNVSDIISMMQGYSGEATNRMWEKYGGDAIIRDTARRYSLQETTSGDSWRTTKSSAVDVSRMLRRFMDDKSVTTAEKRWTTALLNKTSLSVSGEDFSWGLPSAVGLGNGSDEGNNVEDSNLWWAQGWSNSGSDNMVRHSTGVYGDGMRYIVTVMGQVPGSTSNSEANRISSQVSTALIQGNEGNNNQKLSDYGQGTTTVESYTETMNERMGLSN